jgi:hypothetical protein
MTRKRYEGDKWQGDLEAKFGIEARIVSCSQLVDELEQAAPRIGTRSFALIASLEGLRPPAEYDDPYRIDSRSRFARLLERFGGATSEDALFDLVVIDEAHYLRNPETANNRLGRHLREVSRNLVLLTATPIQIGVENLFQLLRLLDPEQFLSMEAFNDSLEQNRPYTRAFRSLWQNPPDSDSTPIQVGNYKHYYATRTYTFSMARPKPREKQNSKT